jgi:hypothetical protein
VLSIKTSDSHIQLATWTSILIFLAAVISVGSFFLFSKWIRARLKHGTWRIKDGTTNRTSSGSDADRSEVVINSTDLTTTHYLPWAGPNISGLVHRICGNKNLEEEPVEPIELDRITII